LGTEVVIEGLIIFVLILINGALAMSEMAIVSARKARLQQLSDEGNSGARRALQLGTDPSSFLASIQIGITLIGILAGAFGGATMADQIASQIATIPGLERFADAIGIGFVVVAVTLLSLVFGELVPKRLALSNAELMATIVARPVQWIAILAHPAVKLLSALTESIVRVLGIHERRDTPITEEEVKIIIEQGEEAGVFQQQEGTIIRRVMDFADRRVSDVMTQRVQLVMLDVDAALQENLEKLNSNPHTYFPAYKGTEDNIVGIVSSKKILQELQRNGGFTIEIRNCISEALYVAETMPVLSVLEKFKQTGKHQALVVDEYGSIAGIVTLTDLLEAIVGDIPSEYESDSTSVVRRDDGSLLVEGMMPIYELQAFLGEKHEFLEDNSDYQTLGGFVMNQLGHIPKEGEKFSWKGFNFEIMDMDKHRVDKVLISRIEGQPS
jgi:putative hemolysin